MQFYLFILKKIIIKYVDENCCIMFSVKAVISPNEVLFLIHFLKVIYRDLLFIFKKIIQYPSKVEHCHVSYSGNYSTSQFTN